MKPKKVSVDHLNEIADSMQNVYLDDYVKEIREENYWDVDFLDYKCYRVFYTTFKEDIKQFRNDFIRDNGREISIQDASWAMYFMATGQEHRFENIITTKAIA